jgi:DNA-binding transcriptional LysR family regulator
MDLRHLRYFVAVADQGSFTRAAEQLGMAQPPLSQQIRMFEEELGITLFQRLTRGVHVTDVGAVLLEQARAMLNLQQQFVASAAGLARGERGHLRVGLAGAAALVPIIPNTIRKFRQQWPEVTIALEENNTPALCKALHARTLDVAIVRPPVTESRGLAIHDLLEEPTLMALPSDHPLAACGELKLEMLAKETLIIFPRFIGPGFYDAILSAYQAAGFTPITGQEAPQLVAMVPMVAAGLGVSIVPSSLSQIHTSGVTFHAIAAPAPKAVLAIATRATTHLPLIAQFVSMFRQSCRSEPVG